MIHSVSSACDNRPRGGMEWHAARDETNHVCYVDD